MAFAIQEWRRPVIHRSQSGCSFGVGHAGPQTPRSNTSDGSTTSCLQFRLQSAELFAWPIHQRPRHAHPRANDFFGSQHQLDDVLTQLAKALPVLVDAGQCLHHQGLWHSNHLCSTGAKPGTHTSSCKLYQLAGPKPQKKIPPHRQSRSQSAAGLC